jgi:hypothetical protein
MKPGARFWKERERKIMLQRDLDADPLICKLRASIEKAKLCPESRVCSCQLNDDDPEPYQHFFLHTMKIRKWQSDIKERVKLFHLIYGDDLSQSNK